MAIKKEKTIPKPSEKPGKKIRIDIPVNPVQKKPETISLEIKKKVVQKKADTVSVEIKNKRPRPEKPAVTVSIFDSQKQIKVPKPPKFVEEPKKPEQKAAPEKSRIIPVPGKPATDTPDNKELKKLKDAFDDMNKSFGMIVKEVNNIKVRTSDIPDRKQIEEIKKALEKKADFTKLSDSDMKSMKNFVSRSDYLEKQVSDTKNKIDDIIKIIEVFTNKVNSLHKDFEDMNTRQASEGSKGYSEAMRDIIDRIGKSEKDSSDMKKRIDEIEGALEHVSENLKEKSSKPIEAKEMKAVLAKIASLENSIKESKEKAVPEVSTNEAKEQTPPESTERLNDFDQRITGINDKLVQISGDLQKLSNYYMDGIRHIETRVNSLENRFYEEHGEELASEMRQEPARIPVPRPKQTLTAPTPVLPPTPYSEPDEQVRFPTPPTSGSGNMFTKLRESTVIRRPYPVPKNEMPDLEILTEHVMESIRRNESTEKIIRDLTYAGYDRELIAKAFMQARVG